MTNKKGEEIYNEITGKSTSLGIKKEKEINGKVIEAHNYNVVLEYKNKQIEIKGYREGLAHNPNKTFEELKFFVIYSLLLDYHIKEKEDIFETYDETEYIEDSEYKEFIDYLFEKIQENNEKINLLFTKEEAEALEDYLYEKESTY